MKVSDDAGGRDRATAGGAERAASGRLRELHGAGNDYLRELELRFGELDLSGLRVLLDCAHGATYRVAPEIFRRLGADVDAIAVEPDGRNINERSARPTSPGWRTGSTATTSRSRSTATATACWRSTEPARSWTATS